MTVDNQADVISRAASCSLGKARIRLAYALAHASSLNARQDKRRFVFRALDRSRRSRPLRQSATLNTCMRTTARYLDGFGVCSVNDLSAYVLLTSSSGSGKRVRLVRRAEICMPRPAPRKICGAKIDGGEYPAPTYPSGRGYLGENIVTQ